MTTTGQAGPVGLIRAALGGAAAAVATRALLRSEVDAGRLGGAGGWTRINHRGEPVTLLQGPALALAATGGLLAAPAASGRIRAAAAVAVAGAGAFGAYDDLAGSGDARGFRGHLAAARRGEVTTGLVKILGIGATGLLAATLLHRRPLDRLLAGAVIAGGANLVNLLDLRPGRATKVAVVLQAAGLVRGGVAAGLVAAPLGAALGLLADDLRERSMLGDCGANALGAAAGVAVAASSGRLGLAAHAAALVGLTAASERVSFTAVIERTPWLSALDGLGRRPAR